MRRFAPIVFSLACLSLGACGEEPRNLREWTPEDHVQPSQPDPARTPASTDESPEMTIARAAATLYARSCANCHGTDGRGGSGAPPGAQMPDLSAPEWHDGNSDADINAVITNGRGMMPAFGTQLNERGVAALVQHLRTLRVN